MKNSVKHFLCISVALLLMLSACKKNDTKLRQIVTHNSIVTHDSVPLRVDFRDSFTGKYSCTYHYSHWCGGIPGYSLDTVLRYDTISVIKQITDTISIVINDKIYPYGHTDTGSRDVFFVYSYNCKPLAVQFFLDNDTIIIQDSVNCSGLSCGFSFYHKGYKIR